MNRLILAIGLIFALATVAGPVTARVLAAGHFSTVSAIADRCAEPAQTVVKAAVFKPCPKKLNGHVIPCQQLPAVLPEIMGCPLPLDRLFHLPEVGTLEPQGVNEDWFRPPRGTERA